MQDPTDLSGLWFGWYTYPHMVEKVEFTAWITATGTVFTGTTLEPNTFAHPDLGELSAELKGTLHDQSVLFEKRYLPVPGTHTLPIVYSGTLSSNGDHMAGQWILESGSGLFELSRLRAANDAANLAARFSITPENDQA